MWHHLSNMNKYSKTNDANYINSYDSRRTKMFEVFYIHKTNFEFVHEHEHASVCLYVCERENTYSSVLR